MALYGSANGPSPPRALTRVALPFEHSSHGLLPSDRATGAICPSGRLEAHRGEGGTADRPAIAAIQSPPSLPWMGRGDHAKRGGWGGAARSDAAGTAASPEITPIIAPPTPSSPGLTRGPSGFALSTGLQVESVIRVARSNPSVTALGELRWTKGPQSGLPPRSSGGGMGWGPQPLRQQPHHSA